MQFDLVVLATIAVILFLYATWKGRGALATFVLSLYPAAFLYSIFPYTDTLIFFKQNSFQIAVSHFIIFLIFVAISRYVLYKTLYSHDFYGGGKLSSVLIAIVSTGALIALMYHLPGLKGLHPFVPTIAQFFASSQVFFWWIIGPILVVLIF